MLKCTKPKMPFGLLWTGSMLIGSILIGSILIGSTGCKKSDDAVVPKGITKRTIKKKKADAFMADKEFAQLRAMLRREMPKARDYKAARRFNPSKETLVKFALAQRAQEFDCQDWEARKRYTMAWRYQVGGGFLRLDFFSGDAAKQYRQSRKVDLAKDRIVESSANGLILYEYKDGVARWRPCSEKTCALKVVPAADFGVESVDTCEWALAKGKLPKGSTCVRREFFSRIGQVKEVFSRVMDEKGDKMGRKRRWVYSHSLTGKLRMDTVAISREGRIQRHIIRSELAGRVFHSYCRSKSLARK